MLTIVIPTLNAERHLPRTIEALVPAAVSGLARQLVIADGGSSDLTERIADAAGADFVRAERGRGSQLAAGAAAATADWILFLHADTRLVPGWEAEVGEFIEEPDNLCRAAAFTFAVDDRRPWARRLESRVRWRNRIFALPYGDQGLLISKRFYRELGGFAPMPAMEDMDMMRRIGRRRLDILHAEAVTSAERLRAEGKALRPLRNLVILTLYAAGVPPRVLARLNG
ncbi:MAG: TIGR04283 family arsenosugar biosynthesis glycosyltransferase [Alphaproteobacteria bacterium]|nr:TIGR04283 family arsenosugar biosynthesis glycosyltransferase [Alphaproteobacteria bacterium]